VIRISILSFLFLWLQFHSVSGQDALPYFPGCKSVKNIEDKRSCSNRELVNFITENLVYPESARALMIEGTVVMGFTVEANGTLSAVKALNKIGEGCEQAAIDVINNMPDWEPGIENGNAIAVSLALPVKFNLEGGPAWADEDYRVMWGGLSSRLQVTRSELVENIQEPIYFLDESGNKVSINEMLFASTRGKKYKDASSTGKINENMKALVAKIKPGAIFSIVGTIQEKGEFIFVEKEWEVIR